MRRILCFGVCFGLMATVVAQGGQAGGGGFGGGGFGGGQGGQGGTLQSYNSRVQALEAEMAEYLKADEVKNILTPGEFSEWKLTLKAGQVVIAEARSDAFDPALEIVDSSEKRLAENDDRFPGDQRPVLLWRCPADGEFSLRARCFRDKSGGQFFLKMNTYDSFDLKVGGVTTLHAEDKFVLLRIPLKSGQIVQLLPQYGQDTAMTQLHTSVSPIGLPNAKVPEALRQVLGFSVIAPVDGDYYVLAGFYGSRGASAQLQVRELPSNSVPWDGRAASMTASAGAPSLWTLGLKQGEIVSASTPDLSFRSPLVIVERPDFSKYDLTKPEENPFFPQPDKPGEKEKAAITMLAGRDRDQRVAVAMAGRDTEVWIASKGDGILGRQYGLQVSRAPSAFVAGRELKADLRIGDTDYWEFDANAGDVMTFELSAEAYSIQAMIVDPDMMGVWIDTADPDETTIRGSIVAKNPGRYLMHVYAYGHGGAGVYTLKRQVFSAKEFRRGSPAVGDFSTGQAEVWKFTVTPDSPVLLHWRATGSYNVSIRDEHGNTETLERTSVDANNQYGVIRVSEPKTYVIVLVSNGSKADYRIEILDLPGLKPNGG